MKRIQPGERSSIRLTNRERKLILDHTFVGGDVERRVRIATANGPSVVVALDLDDQEELLGHVAAAANHSKRPTAAKHLRQIQMVLTLETRGLIERVPGKPRSIRLLLGRDDLPDLE